MTSTTDRYLQGPTDPLAAAPRPIDPGVTIGYVHLCTADIDQWPRDGQGRVTMGGGELGLADLLKELAL